MRLQVKYHIVDQWKHRFSKATRADLLLLNGKFAERLLTMLDLNRKDLCEEFILVIAIK